MYVQNIVWFLKLESGIIIIFLSTLLYITEKYKPTFIIEE